MRLHVNRKRVLYYIIFIGFLYPKGFTSLSTIYKSFFTLWLYVSIVLIFVFLWRKVRKVRLSFSGAIAVAYFLGQIIITYLKLGKFGEGLQRLFAFPILCLFFAWLSKEELINVIKSITNILLIDFIGQFLFYPIFSSLYHITFLGHVQLISQISVLALLCAILLLYIGEYKQRAKILIILSVAISLTADANAAILLVIMLAFAFVIYRFKLQRFLEGKSKIYFVIMLVFNIIVLYVVIGLGDTVEMNIAKWVLNLNGRQLIWRSAAQVIDQHLILGYGVYGTYITVSWTTLNYLHSQLLQNLLDGGIVICVLYYLMLYLFARKIDIIKNKSMKGMLNVILIFTMFLMIFESVTLYCYVFVIYSIINVAYKLEDNVVQESFV